MPALSWPEIRTRATRFANEWRDVSSEQAEAQTSIAINLNLYGSKC